MTKILFWIGSLGRLLGGDQTIIMILLGAICRNIESLIWSIFSSWVTTVPLQMTFIFAPQFFSITIQRGILIRKYNELINNEKNLKSEKGNNKKKSCRNFASLEVRAKCGWITTEKNWVTPVFYFSLFKQKCFQNSIFLAPGISFIWCVAIVLLFIHSFILSKRYVLRKRYEYVWLGHFAVQ